VLECTIVTGGAIPNSDVPTRARLSVVLAVCNEAATIAECVQHLDFADEIVVVDMESDDETAEICRGLGSRVIVHDGGPHRLIHVNKNVGFEAARCPWVLNLDADERVSEKLRDEILALLDNPPPETAAYALPYTHYFFGKYLRYGGFGGHLVRLFRRGSLRYPEDRAHSSPIVDGRTEELENLVVHFNHLNIASFVEKMNRYTSSDAPLMVEHGRGGLRNRRIPDRLAVKLLTAPLSVFWNRYVRHSGFRDGVHGLVAASLLAFYQFVEYAKVWEKLNVGEDPAALEG
jgi:glycosyltransferase involved in cell wall biosynthesis